jgi:hypothetical protein
VTDPALLLVVADAAVRRGRAALAAGDAWAWEDPAHQRGVLERLVEAEERAARLRGVYEWGDLPELRQRLAEVTRWAAGGAGLFNSGERGARRTTVSGLASKTACPKANLPEN